MEKIQDIFVDHPYYWARRISKQLRRDWYNVWRRKAKHLMEILCIAPIYPKERTSIPNKEHAKYPYLLKWLDIVRPNQVWSTDITYIRLPHGFVYLMSVIDRYSRRIISRDISPTMDKEFCCWVLKEALKEATPEIFNTDQWSQFTSNEFIKILEESWTKISMDWIWRCYDNIRIERLWRTIKYEDIRLHDYKTPNDVYHWLSLYIPKYNSKRLHSSIGYRTPDEVYYWRNEQIDYEEILDKMPEINWEVTNED